MQVVDAQVHIWGANTPDRPWVATDRAQRPTPFSADDAVTEMREAGVDAAILVPPTFEGNRNDLVLAAARRHPDLFAVMGRIDLDDPDSGREIVAAWRTQPGALGFRLVLTPGSDATRTRPGSWLTDGEAEWFFAAAAEHGVPVMVHVIGLLPEIQAVAARYPTLRLVIDHLGLPAAARIERSGDLVDQLRPLAELDNVAVKVGALPCYTDEPYPYPSWQAELRRVVDWYGAHRVFWASDVTRLPGPCRQVVEFFSSELPFLTDAERSSILGAGIVDWLRWDRPARG
jgi:L-fuconolactonase